MLTIQVSIILPPPISQNTDNQRVNKRKKIFNNIGKAAGITLLALLFSTLLISPFTASVSSMFSSPEKSDFVMSDLFAQVADARPVRLLDDRIVLIDIGHADREQIADALDILALCAPRRLGLDINFAAPSEDDSHLLQALSNIPSLVMPLGLEHGPDGHLQIADRPFFFNDLEGIDYGAINLPTKHEGGTVREFAVNIASAEGDIPSFVMQMAGDDPAARQLRVKNKRTALIYYPSREFRVIPIDKIEENAEIIADKYVMMGAMNEAGDMHATPVNSYMAGMQIHAHALATVLDGHELRKIPDKADYIPATLCCFALALFCVSFGGKFRGLLLRIIQLTLLFLAVRIGYALYVDKGIVCNFPYTFLMLTFGLFAYDIWNGLEACVAIIKRKLTFIKQ